MCAIRDRLWQALRTVQFPGYNRDTVSFGLVQRVAKRDGVATTSLELDAVAPETRDQLVARARDVLLDVPCVRSVEAQLAEPPETRHQKGHPGVPERLPGVRHVVAVGSGEGPLEPAVRGGGDLGRPAVLIDGSVAGRVLREFAGMLSTQLEIVPTLAERGARGRRRGCWALTW